jgi:hypothetical protein
VFGSKASSFGLAASALLLSACGAPPAKAPAASAPPASSSASRAPVAPLPAPPVAEPQVEQSPGFADTMALLRPPGTEGALQALAAAPSDAAAHAQAALAYAPSDVPAMTLLWGLTYQAMGGGAADADVAAALSKVLAERITAAHDEQTKQVSFNLRLAPGQMPVRKAADGSVYAPLAHVFEGLFSPAVTGFRPPWTIEQFYDVLSTWVGVLATHGTALDDTLELDAWLVALAKAGHLEAFCYRLLGPAFPAELKAYKAAHGAELKAYQEFSKASALRPKRAVMPDDLIRIQ